MVGSYLISAMDEVLAGGSFYRVNHSESLHYVQPLMAEGSRVGESDRQRKRDEVALQSF